MIKFNLNLPHCELYLSLTFKLIIHLIFIISNYGRQHFHQHPLLNDTDGLGGEDIGAGARHRHQPALQPRQHSRDAAELRIAGYVRRDEQLDQGAAGE